MKPDKYQTIECVWNGEVMSKDKKTSLNVSSIRH